jgi:hypothetical protein
LKKLAPGQNANVMEELSSVIRESAQDTNDNKQYYLNQLQEVNKISSELSDQFELISEASRRLSKKEKKDNDP